MTRRRPVGVISRGISKKLDKMASPAALLMTGDETANG